MLVVALTGGIGAGKTTVAQLFAEKGATIIDTDIIARELTEPGQQAYQAIIQHFKNENVLENGTLNRRKLRKLIFDKHEEKRWLENLLHPLIRQEVDHQLKQVVEGYCIVIIPLLYEAEGFPNINRILVIDTPMHMQVERVKTRDNLVEKDVNAILKQQATREQRLSIAHDTIINDGKLEDLMPQVEELHQFYLTLSNTF